MGTAEEPENLTTGQCTALAKIAADDRPLYKGYLIKEQLREALHARGDHGKALLNSVIAWAARSRIPEFAKLAKPSPATRPSSSARSTTGHRTDAPRH